MKITKEGDSNQKLTAAEWLGGGTTSSSVLLRDRKYWEGLAVRWGVKPEDTCDILQNVVVKFLELPGDVKYNRAYVCRMVRSASMDYNEKKKRGESEKRLQDLSDSAMEPTDNGEGARRMKQNSLRRDLERGLSQLPKTVGAVLRLRYFEGDSAEVIAAKLHLVPESVHQYTYKGLRALREWRENAACWC